MTAITIEVDTVLGSAYIRLSQEPIERTVEFSDEFLVDLDKNGVAVGIEVLDEGAVLPFAELVDRFHVHSDVVNLLRLIRPSVSSYLAFSTGHDGVTGSTAAGRSPLPA